MQGAWQDLQGTIRITSMSETIVLDRISFTVLRPAADGGLDQYYIFLTGSALAVPEPSTLGLLVLGALAVLVYRMIRSKRNVPLTSALHSSGVLPLVRAHNITGFGQRRSLTSGGTTHHEP